MAARYAETPADRASWARLWDIVTGPWDRLEDLASFLGVGRTTVQEWLPDGRNAGAGPWPLLRLALRRTARRYPVAVPEIVRLLVADLLDVEGRWVPATTDEPGPYAEESQDVVDALSELRAALRSGEMARVERARVELVRQAEEAARAAVGQA